MGPTACSSEGSLCKVTPVTLHGVVSPYRDFTHGVVSPEGWSLPRVDARWGSGLKRQESGIEEGGSQCDGHTVIVCESVP